MYDKDDSEVEPLCAVHRHLEDADKLECEIGNDCVACSLNERRELLELIAPFANNGEDSITVLRRVVEFYQTHPALVATSPAPPSAAATVDGKVNISFEPSTTDAASGGICPKCGGSIPTCCRCPLPCARCGHVGMMVKGLCRAVVNEFGPQNERRVCGCACYTLNTTQTAAASPVAPRDEAAPSRLVGSSRHPHFTAADHQRMKETLDALPDYPTEEEAEAVLQACGTSGKEVVNEFIERLLTENLELKTKLDAASSSPSPRELAQAAAEGIVSVFPEIKEHDKWVTLGRVKIDIETETETFEPAIAPKLPVLDQIAAIILRVCFNKED